MTNARHARVLDRRVCLAGNSPTAKPILRRFSAWRSRRCWSADCHQPRKQSQSKVQPFDAAGTLSEVARKSNWNPKTSEGYRSRLLARRIASSSFSQQIQQRILALSIRIIVVNMEHSRAERSFRLAAHGNAGPTFSLVGEDARGFGDSISKKGIHSSSHIARYRFPFDLLEFNRATIQTDVLRYSDSRRQRFHSGTLRKL